MNKTKLTGLPLTALAVALAGCASTEPNQSLEQARTAVRSAEGDPAVVESAAIELERARESLAAAERIYEEEGNSEPERLEHQSYLASRYAETAMTVADGARADERIEAAEAERNRVLLEIRTAEAEQRANEAEVARLAAQQNARQAELERQRARSAQARAQSLAEQLEDLEARQTDRGIVLTLGDVLFDVDKSELKPGATSTMDRLADFLNEYPDRDLLIEGHTDSTGPDQYNQQLSVRRADAVAMALEQRGVPGTRLDTRGLGESRPVATNDTSAGRQQNRRVEVIVTEE